MESTIYALCEPSSGEIRYIGKTAIKPSRRLVQHVALAKTGFKSHLHCWIRSLDTKPIMRPLCTVARADDSELEMLLIADLRASGYRLTNTTAGGDGFRGVGRTAEHNRKIGDAIRGKKRTPEQCAAISAGKKGRSPAPKSAEHRAKISASNTGKKRTVETKQKISAARSARVGWKHSPETIERMRAAAYRRHAVN